MHIRNGNKPVVLYVFLSSVAVFGHKAILTAHCRVVSRINNRVANCAGLATLLLMRDILSKPLHCTPVWCCIQVCNVIV